MVRFQPLREPFHLTARPNKLFLEDSETRDRVLGHPQFEDTLRIPQNVSESRRPRSPTGGLSPGLDRAVPARQTEGAPVVRLLEVMSESPRWRPVDGWRKVEHGDRFGILVPWAVGHFRVHGQGQGRPGPERVRVELFG